MILPFFRRRRLFFWLLRAYLRRWSKTILFFFALGIFLAFGVLKVLPKFLILGQNTQTIGLVGAYSIDNLPLEIQRKISQGLTELNENGTARPGIATSWQISPDGKIYTLTLKNDVFFQDGKKLQAQDINYNFKDAKFTILGKNQIQFTLNEPFVPFLAVISQPIFKKGLVGMGEYKIKKISLSNSFISSLTLENTQQKNIRQLTYYFYPTEEALKTAFILGEVDIISDIYDVSKFQNWPNLTIEKNTKANEEVAIFFNLHDSFLSQKNIRQALIYALPETFTEGKTAYSPLSFKSFAFQNQSEKFVQNKEKAKELLGTSNSGTLNLIADPRLENLAKKLAQNWQEIGIKTKIEISRNVPTAGNFQAFLGVFRIPPDPDQYVLWHSTQQTNISGYANPKIDKLLEDGRKTQDQMEREKIYADFQKYLVDDAPAAFLYYPTVYTVRRK